MSKVRLCKIDAEGSEIAILQTLTPQHLATIDSFAAEIHPEAYSTRELAETVLSWGTHQMGFNDEREFSAPIMRIISNRLLLDGISVSKSVSVDSQTSNGAGSDAGEATFVEAAHAIGMSHTGIALRHILPNTLAPLIVLATAQLGSTILTEASLSFLGLGVPEPWPSWGRMLSDSAAEYMRTAPWLVIFPGIAISLVVFGSNLLGDALRNSLDPRQRH